MTNAQIIEDARLALIKQGIIKPDEEIHTFRWWKTSGCKVKKGEHAVIQIVIWKKPTKQKTTDDDTVVEAVDPMAGCFLKKSYFFATHQIEACDT